MATPVLGHILWRKLNLEMLSVLFRADRDLLERRERECTRKNEVLRIGSM